MTLYNFVVQQTPLILPSRTVVGTCLNVPSSQLTTSSNTAQWGLYYSARDAYGPLVPSLGQNDSLSPSFWHNVTEAFSSNDTAFQTYNTFMSRGLKVPACDADCKKTTICGLQAMRAEDNCVSAALLSLVAYLKYISAGCLHPWCTFTKA